MTSVSRLKSSSRLIGKIKPTVPTKLKGGKLERIGTLQQKHPKLFFFFAPPPFLVAHALHVLFTDP